MRRIVSSSCFHERRYESCSMIEGSVLSQSSSVMARLWHASLLPVRYRLLMPRPPSAPTPFHAKAILGSYSYSSSHPLSNSRGGRGVSSALRPPFKAGARWRVRGRAPTSKKSGHKGRFFFFFRLLMLTLPIRQHINTDNNRA